MWREKKNAQLNQNASVWNARNVAYRCHKYSKFNSLTKTYWAIMMWYNCVSHFFIDIVMVPVWRRKKHWVQRLVLFNCYRSIPSKTNHASVLENDLLSVFFAILPQRSNCSSSINIRNTRSSTVVILKSENVIYFENFLPVITNRHFEKCVQCTICW